MDGRKGGLLLTLIIAAMMLSVIFSFSVDSLAGTPIPNTTLEWEYSDGTLTITGTGTFDDYSTIERPPWEEHISTITTVIIGDQVTSIGDYSFYGYEHLVTLKIGMNVAYLGQSAFENCTALTSLYLPNSVTSIGETAFKGCASLTEVSFGPLSSMAVDAFDGFTLVGNVGPTTDVDELKNKAFLLTSPGTLMYAGHSVYFETNGGSYIPMSVVAEDTVVAAPANPTRSHYNFDHWYTDEGFTSQYDFDSLVSMNMVLYANWTPVNYPITYYLQCDDATVATPNPATYNITQTIILNDPSRTGYTFDGWFDAPTGGNHITQIDSGTYGAKALYAQWTESPSPPVPPTQYSVKFYSEGTLVQTSSLSVGQVIVAPADPSKAPETKYEYTFKEWNGFTTGMLMTAGDKRFDAVFVKSANVGYDAVREEYTATVDEDSALITKAKIDEIVDKAKNDRDTTMILKAGDYSVRFDNDALRSLKSADAELAIEKKEYSDLTVAEKKITKGSPLFDITFGENTNFGDGKVTITVPFDKGDKDASLLYVAHILDGKVNEEIECTYNDDGTVSFSTGHLSVYTMLYKEAKKTHFLESMSVEQFIVFGVIFAIAMSAILLAVFKKMKG